MSLTKMVHNSASLYTLAMPNFDANDQAPMFAPGTEMQIRDVFGVRYLRYIKNAHSAALVHGDVVTRAADVAFTAGALVTSTRVTTTGLTANAHVGKILVVEGNDVAAGAAPENEAGVIVSNSATQIDLDPTFPFSVASVADVDCRIVTPGWHGIQSGAAVPSRDIQGVVLGTDGISVGNYGWVVYDGWAVAKATAAAISAGAKLCTAASGAVVAQSSEGLDDVIGYAPAAAESTHIGKVPIVLTLLRSRQNI